MQKNGKLAQREQLSVPTDGASQNYQSRSVASELAQRAAEGLFKTTADMLAAAGKTAASFQEVMLEPLYITGANILPQSEAKQKKKRKKSPRASR